MSDKDELLKYLKTKKLMSLATVNENKPWICSVYYAIDNDFNIFFMSYNRTNHVEHILKNNIVAATITDSNQRFDDKKIGVQLEGEIEVLKLGSEHTVAQELWLLAVSGFSDKDLFAKSGMRAMSGLFFKLKIKKAKYLNENLYGEFGSREIDF